jgi:putative N6-adenine-specific DNA methylase
MCGSGTLLCEALMHYCHIPAQIFRKEFGFERLPDFDASLWERVKIAAKEAIVPLPERLMAGSDISDVSVNAVKTNLMGLHFGGNVQVDLADFKTLSVIEDSIIITNPPYGIRMGRDQDMNLFYKDLGIFLKSRCQNCTAYVYFGEPKFIKKVPLSPAWKRPLKIGGLDGKLVKYELYSPKTEHRPDTNTIAQEG